MFCFGRRKMRAVEEIPVPEEPHLTADSSHVPDIDSAFTPTHDEFSRQRFVSLLRRFVLTDMREEMRRDYERRVQPAYEKAQGKSPENGREIERAMNDSLPYR